MTSPNQNQESHLGSDEEKSPPPFAGAAADNDQSFSRQFERFVNGFEMAMVKIDARFDILDAKIESVNRELNGKIESLDVKIESVNREVNGKIESVRREIQSFGKRLDGFGVTLNVLSGLFLALTGAVITLFVKS